MSLHEMFSRRPEWESAIGRLMMASAHLEMNVLMAIANYGGTDLARKASRSGHSARLNVLEGLAADLDTKKQASVSRIVETLREFNRKRNHVAHNSLVYALDQSSAEEHKYGSIIDFAQPEQRIGLDDIIALAKNGENLSRGFTFTWMMVMGVPK